MKKLITASALGLALVAGTASADKITLMEDQLDSVNAGLALANANALAGANGAFFAATNTATNTNVVSGLAIFAGFFITPSASISSSLSQSAAF